MTDSFDAEDIEFAELLEKGALDMALDDDGEPYFTINDRTKELAPEFYNAWMEELDQDLLSLVNKGLVRVEYDENLEATFELTPEGREYIMEVLEMLGDSDRPS